MLPTADRQLLQRDLNNAVGAAQAVPRRIRGIFQHFDGFDVLDGDHVDRVPQSAVEDVTVYNEQGFVAAFQGFEAADGDVRIGVIAGNGDAGHPAEVVDQGNGTFRLPDAVKTRMISGLF